MIVKQVFTACGVSIAVRNACAAIPFVFRAHTAAEPTGLAVDGARTTRENAASAFVERGEEEAGGAFAGIGVD